MCIVLYCIVLYSILLYSTIDKRLSMILLYSIVFYCILLDFRMVDKKENAWKAVAARLERSGEYFTQFFVLAPS